MKQAQDWEEVPLRFTNSSTRRTHEKTDSRLYLKQDPLSLREGEMNSNDWLLLGVSLSAPMLLIFCAIAISDFWRKPRRRYWKAFAIAPCANDEPSLMVLLGIERLTALRWKLPNTEDLSFNTIFCAYLHGGIPPLAASVGMLHLEPETCRAFAWTIARLFCAAA